jgi:hypothetical protein
LESCLLGHIFEPKFWNFFFLKSRKGSPLWFLKFGVEISPNIYKETENNLYNGISFFGGQLPCIKIWELKIHWEESYESLKNGLFEEKWPMTCTENRGKLHFWRHATSHISRKIAENCTFEVTQPLTFNKEIVQFLAFFPLKQAFFQSFFDSENGNMIKNG